MSMEKKNNPSGVDYEEIKTAALTTDAGKKLCVSILGKKK